MAVKIKLQHKGKRDSKFFRITVQEERSKRGGKYIDLLGFYNPEINPPMLKLDKKKYEKWIQNGAKPTQSLMKILKNHNQ